MESIFVLVFCILMPTLAAIMFGITAIVKMRSSYNRYVYRIPKIRK